MDYPYRRTKLRATDRMYLQTVFLHVIENRLLRALKLVSGVTGNESA